MFHTFEGNLCTLGKNACSIPQYFDFNNYKDFMKFYFFLSEKIHGQMKGKFILEATVARCPEPLVVPSLPNHRSTITCQ